MSPTTNFMLNRTRYEGCFNITTERKYYYLPESKTFIKRSFLPREWQVSVTEGTIHVPRLGSERLRNEAASLSYIREHTSIPVPKVMAAFDDDEAFYLIIEYIEGVSMNDLEEDQKHIVARELEGHLSTLQGLRSRKLGGPSGIIIPPYRAMLKTVRDHWKMDDATSAQYVFCHNDLSQNNFVVDPDTLKIRAILDWEYAGFYPGYFESRFFHRLGPSTALPGEADDSDTIADFFVKNHRH